MIKELLNNYTPFLIRDKKLYEERDVIKMLQEMSQIKHTCNCKCKNEAQLRQSTDFSVPEVTC